MALSTSTLNISKAKLAFLMLAILAICSGYNAQSIAWAKQEGGHKNEESWLITTDTNGNSYLLATFQSSTTVGNQIFSDVNGEHYLAKYDTYGNFAWAKQISKFQVSKIKAFGNFVYLCGAITQTAHIGSASFVSTGFNDGVIIRIDQNGNSTLVTKATGTGNEIYTDIDTDRFGNIYAIGTYDTLSIFSSDTLRGTANFNYFLIKYNAAGNVLWKNTGTQKSESTSGSYVSVDKDGQHVYTLIYVSGEDAQDSVTFSNSNIYYNPFNYYGYLILKHNSAGTLQAYKPYYLGNHAGMVGIDQDTCGNMYLAWAGIYSHFSLIKYDSTFNQAWNKVIWSGSQSDFASMLVTNKGDLYLTGSFDQKISFPGDTLKISSPYSSFVAKYDQAGNYKWSIKMEKDSSNIGNAARSISTDGHGHLFICGFFSDSLYAGNNAFCSAGYGDVYLAKINDEELFVGLKGYAKENKDESSVFPNPSRDVIRTNQSISKIYDAAGNIIYSATKPTTTVMDLSGQPKGIYFVELKDGEKRTVKKVVLN